jgi:hypothetical protein
MVLQNFTERRLPLSAMKAGSFARALCRIVQNRAAMPDASA